MTKQQYIKILEQRRKRRMLKRKIKKILSIGIFFLIIGIIFSNISLSHNELTTKTIKIAYGETLWKIAKREKAGNEYLKNKDIREIIYELKEINNIEDNSYLKEGEELKIPIYKTE